MDKTRMVRMLLIGASMYMYLMRATARYDRRDHRYRRMTATSVRVRVKAIPDCCCSIDTSIAIAIIVAVTAGVISSIKV